MTEASRLHELPISELIERLASSDPIPGGGSASAIAGAMAAALVGMVVELSLGRPAHEAHADELRQIGAAAAECRAELVALADRDASAYEGVIRARRLPRESGDQRRERHERVAQATRDATLAPLRTAQVAADVLDLAGRVAPTGNPNAASDAGVAARLAVAAVHGAALNVRINLPYLAADDPLRERAADDLDGFIRQLSARESDVLAAVAERMGGDPP